MTDSKEWHVARGNESIGPLSIAELRSGFRSGQYTPDALVFKQGMSGWTAASQVAELATLVDGGASGAPPLPPPSSGKHSHEVDYKIVGEEMQFIEVELDPGEGAIAEAGAMMYMTSGIQMNTIFGDGSGQGGGGLMDQLLGAGKRVLTGESLFITEFMNQGSGKQHVAFASPYPGKIMAVDLSKRGGKLIAQKDAFLCAAKGVAISIAFQKKIGVALFGGEGFIMQSLEGDGLAFLHAGGTIIERELAAGEHLRVDTGCLVALDPSVTYDIQFVGGIKSAIFGGEGFFFASLAGPGTVWLQSLPFSRLAGRIWKAAPQTGGGGKGEGSVLDHLGGIGQMFQR
ncbi:MAG: TIGR00266 family protein [Acidobacteriota bacterium]|nr:MAG: TIGR00266 family protein [Acidobacteriota bacterium]